MTLCKDGILFLDFLEALHCVNQDLNHAFNLRLIAFNRKFLATDCVDADICELAEAVRKQMNSSKGVNVTSERPEINLTTEVYSCLENNHMIPATEHR